MCFQSHSESPSSMAEIISQTFRNILDIYRGTRYTTGMQAALPGFPPRQQRRQPLFTLSSHATGKYSQSYIHMLGVARRLPNSSWLRTSDLAASIHADSFAFWPLPLLLLRGRQTRATTRPYRARRLEGEVLA